MTHRCLAVSTGKYMTFYLFQSRHVDIRSVIPSRRAPVCKSRSGKKRKRNKDKKTALDGKNGWCPSSKESKKETKNLCLHYWIVAATIHGTDGSVRALRCNHKRFFFRLCFAFFSVLFWAVCVCLCFPFYLKRTGRQYPSRGGPSVVDKHLTKAEPFHTNGIPFSSTKIFKKIKMWQLKPSKRCPSIHGIIERKPGRDQTNKQTKKRTGTGINLRREADVRERDSQSVVPEVPIFTFFIRDGHFHATKSR